jgi:hypothetical protein
MSDFESIERRLEQIERKLDEAVRKEADTGNLDDVLKKRVTREAAGEPEPARRNRRRVSRVFWGIFIVAVGGIWLAQNMDWLTTDIHWWPIALIVFGLYMIFGSRDW